MKIRKNKLLPLRYNLYQFSIVKSISDLLESNLPEKTKLSKLFNSIKTTFGLAQERITIQVAMESRAYKFIILDPTASLKMAFPIATFVFIPEENRLDLWDFQNPVSPAFQWKNKELSYSSVSDLMFLAGSDKIFRTIVNSI